MIDYDFAFSGDKQLMIIKFVPDNDDGDNLLLNIYDINSD